MSNCAWSIKCNTWRTCENKDENGFFITDDVDKESRKTSCGTCRVLERAVSLFKCVLLVLTYPAFSYPYFTPLTELLKFLIYNVALAHTISFKFLARVRNLLISHFIFPFST